MNVEGEYQGWEGSLFVRVQGAGRAGRSTEGVDPVIVPHCRKTTPRGEASGRPRRPCVGYRIVLLVRVQGTVTAGQSTEREDPAVERRCRQ